MLTQTVTRRIATWSGVAALSLTLAACGGTDEDDPSVPGANAPGGTTETPTGAESPTAGSDAAPGGELTAENAVAAIATVESDGGVVHDLDRSDDESAWELEVVRDGVEHDVTVSPDGASVLDEIDTGEVDADDLAEHDAAGITITEAIEAAAAERTEPLEGASLDEDDGTLVWTVEFDGGDDDVEVHVDAADGTVLGTET
ncbi:PepSY domain-containing protein [Georgenia subflava]|uniref:PepSY domain-containing protein n=1 Tax=Georgenia subflava TaxID=1622177 RepID=A0A6N7EMQ3_9MICO|nr:PepSY domain-containing protein [Georgenia subflava]MPV37426.1 hypothetical protein [Georgenia subflava]